MTEPASRAALTQMLVGAAIIGTNGMMVRLSHTSPTVSAFWRMLIATIVLALLVQFRHGWRRMPRKVWIWIAVAALAFSSDLWMWHRSIMIVGPGLSTLLANAQVFFMAMAGVLVFGEHLAPRFYAGLLCAFFGLWLLLGGDWATLPASYHWGVWLGLAAGIGYAGYNVGIKRSQEEVAKVHAHVPVTQVLCMATAGCAILLGIAALVEGDSFAIPDVQSALVLVVLAVFGHCLGWILISRAMQSLGAGMVGLLLLLQPIVAYVLDILVYPHTPTSRQWLGLAVSLAGIFIAGLQGKKKLLPDATPEAPATGQ
ncbi:DMT family transporter [Solilutibacter silvestris]|uniref:EamA-like transporter n=1 Tax=Solilutibacter silvestris TaxID=1645665 RepID=A0A2K1PXL3_9GAMM|nr:DMT family transporter [Lysobacter silvestris]PNS07522.1 EamA-like transporter [Lysobacter silvestris]